VGLARSPIKAQRAAAPTTKRSSLNHRKKLQRATRAEPTCKDEVGLITDYLADRLNPKILAAFEKHLGQCPDCTAFLNTYKKTIEATKSFLKIQTLKFSPKPLRSSKRPGLLDLLFWLHLFICNATLTT
jgi:Putative zinc-finger